jgi:trk system potassium uptake protein TrkA
VKIIIAGNGKVGETLAKLLATEGYELTIIDSDSSVLERSVESLDIMALMGNCASMETLRDAGVESADLLIATTGSDELNLLCCMTAHTMNPGIHTIARIRAPEYSEQIYKMRDKFGLSLTFNPEKQAAGEIERLIKYPGFSKRDSSAKGRVEIVELKIEKDSKLCDVSLNVMYSSIKCKVLVCAVLRDGKAIAPDGNFTLREGDKIFVTAPTDTLSVLLKNLGIVTHKVKNVTIVGGGTLSYYLADLLEKSKISVKIIEKNLERCEKLAELLPKATVLHGDAVNHHFLESEGALKSDALIALTGLDELNMVISLYGNSHGVPQIITKLARVDDSKIIDSLPLGSVVSPRKLCCNTIVRYVRAIRNQTGAAVTIHSIADNQLEAIEFRVDSNTLNCGIPLKKLKLRKNILVACITRGDATEIPNGDSCFTEGDSVVIVSSGDSPILQLNDIFE